MKTAIAIASLVLPCAAAPAAAEPEPPRRNVLFIAVDDLRPELGSYGAPVVSPNIDRLASDGIRFARAYTEVAACAASRASLLTGTYSHTTRVATMFPALSKVRPDLMTMPRLFKDAGYETVELGKFAHTADDTPDAWTRQRWVPDDLSPPHYASPGNRIHSGVRSPRGPFSEAPDVADDAYPDGRLALRAVEELQRLRDRPFFLALGFTRPHLPFNCPRRYWNLYDRSSIRVPDTEGMRGVAEQELHGSYEVRMYRGNPTEKAARMIHGYRACVSYVDAQIGLVLAALERLELAERTVVVLWGDHGWHLGEHGLWGKFTALEPSLRIPLIVRAPGVAGGASTEGLVETVDVFPTLCDLVGLDVPSEVQGISFVPLMRDPQRAWKQAVFGSRRTRSERFPMAALTVRTPRYRLVRWVRGDAFAPLASELYDHETDPREYVNLAGRSDQRARLHWMNAMIDRWLRRESVGHPRRDGIPPPS